MTFVGCSDWRTRCIAISLMVLFCAALLHAQSKPASNCTPNFPFKSSWWGADAAYSIPLKDGRSVWIFGDTLYGDKRVIDGTDPRMVRNSIGISKCDDRGWNIDYVIKRGDEGRPQDFFHAQHPKTWYWAMDAFVYKNDLWVTLLCLLNTPKTSASALGFETCGTDLAKVSGLDADPQQWSVKYYPLVADGVRAYPSATAVVDGDYVYIFALFESGARPMVLTRIPLDGLDDPAKHLQYLAKSGAWEPGLKPADAMHVMQHGNTEMTVRYHPGLKEWIAIMNYPKLFSDKIILRTAPRITGPWSEGKAVYTIPEMQKGTAGFDKDTFCYAAKEHPEFREPDSMLITYACNTMTVRKLITNLGIYFPKVVRIALPQR